VIRVPAPTLPPQAEAVTVTGKTTQWNMEGVVDVALTRTAYGPGAVPQPAFTVRVAEEDSPAITVIFVERAGIQVTPSQHTENLLFGGDCAAASVTSPPKPPKLSTVIEVVTETA